MLWHPMYGSMSFSLFCRGCGSTAIGRSVWRLATNTWRRVTTSLQRHGRLQPNGEIAFQMDDMMMMMMMMMMIMMRMIMMQGNFSTTIVLSSPFFQAVSDVSQTVSQLNESVADMKLQVRRFLWVIF